MGANSAMAQTPLERTCRKPLMRCRRAREPLAAGVAPIDC
jgi:hypothetical protein